MKIMLTFKDRIKNLVGDYEPRIEIIEAKEFCICDKLVVINGNTVCNTNLTDSITVVL